MTHLCYPFEIYYSYVTNQLNKIQVAWGNCNYSMLKGFNMKDIYGKV